MKKIISVFLISIAVAFLFSSCSGPLMPQGWALIYGIENYPSGKSLAYTVDDAEALAELLDDQGWNVTLRRNSEADMPTLLSDIEFLKQKMTEDDRFIFYFSGHGAQLALPSGEETDTEDSLDEVLALSGSLPTIYNFMNGNTSADVLGVTISDDSLAEILSGLPTRNKTVIIDACYSGGFIGDGFTFNNISSDYTLYETSETFAPIEAMNLYAGYTAVEGDLSQHEFTVLAASGGNEESYETPDLQHGVFTYFLLQSPSHADFNLDGYISLTEAWKYISASIDSFWNTSPYIKPKYQFMSNLAAFPVDPVLFNAF